MSPHDHKLIAPTMIMKFRIILCKVSIHCLSHIPPSAGSVSFIYLKPYPFHP